MRMLRYGDVLAEKLEAAEPQGYVAERDINGESAVFGVKKL